MNTTMLADVLNLRPTADYVFDWSDAEVQRLHLQGSLLRRISASFLASAGIHQGMTVLDVGCGAGDSTEVLSRLVGLAGKVVAIDINRDAVDACARYCDQQQLSNVTVEQADLRELPPSYRADAVYGRLVLAYAADQSEAIGALVPHVRPGGLMCFQEFDHTRLPMMSAELGDWDFVHQTVIGSLQHARVAIDMFDRLPTAVKAHCDGEPVISLDALATTDTELYCRYMHLVVGQLRSVIARANLGAASARLLDDAFWNELCERTSRTSGVMSISPLVSISARV